MKNLIIAIAFLTTEFQKLRDHWAQYSALKKQNKIGTNRAMGRNVDLGGLFIIIDWKSKNVLKQKILSCPSGFDINENNFVVASMRENQIYILSRNLKIEGVISNAFLNDVHSVHFTRNGFLVTSSGLDLILEINESGDPIWEWWAVENGFSKDQFGKKRIIDKKIDNRTFDFPTLHQTTHLNAAIFRDEKETKILATLFHQGQIIEINKYTKEWQTKIRHLRNPHAIYKIPTAHYLVSDSKNNRALLLDKNFEIDKIFAQNFDWVQDAIKLSKGTFLIADVNHYRIVELNKEGVIIDYFRYPSDWKVHQIMEIY